MTEIVGALDSEGRDRIAKLRRDGTFLWVDLSAAEVDSAGLADVLDVPELALSALMNFDDRRPASRKFHVDGRLIVFPVGAYLALPPSGHSELYRLRPVEVHVLVCDEYLLTLHHERVSLPDLLAPQTPEGRGDKYVVYGVLDAMLASAFDALNEVESTLNDLAVMSTNLRGGPLRMATLRAASSQLAAIRRQVGSQRGLFERAGAEIGRLHGLDAEVERGLDRLAGQANHLVDAVDVALSSMATLIELRLNETNYWLTVVATVFLPLTFITGFFGMNFGWLVGEIDTQMTFWLLGVGSLVVGVALIWAVVVRGSPVRGDRGAPDQADRVG